LDTSLLFLIAIIVIGAILRLINIGNEPFWGDEALSTDIVTYFPNVKQLIIYLRLVEVHPPLYYIMLHYWINLFGSSEFSTRIPSYVAGLIVILFTYRLGIILFSKKRVALLATLIVAVLPIQIEFSHVARPYIFVALSGVVASYALWRYLESSKLKYALSYIVALAVGLYFHYSALFVAIALASYWFIIVFSTHRRDNTSVGRQIFNWFIIHAAIFVAFYPWLDTVLYKLFLGQYQIFEIVRTSGNTFRELGLVSIDRLLWMDKDYLVSSFVIFAIGIAKISMIGFFIYFFLSKREQAIVLIRTDGRALFFVSWIVFVPFVPFMLTPLSLSYTPVNQQHILTSSVFLALLIGYLFDVTPKSSKQRAVLTILFLASLMNFSIEVMADDSQGNRQYRLRETARFVSANYRTGDLVMVDAAYLRSDFNHYLRSDVDTVSFYPPNFYGNDFLSSRQTLGLVENEMQMRLIMPNRPLSFMKMQYLIKLYKPQRVWLAYFPTRNYAEQWLFENGWQLRFPAQEPLLPVSLYEKP